MKQAHPRQSLSRMCWLFGVTRQAYYKHHKASAITSNKDSVVLQLVDEIRALHPVMGGRKMYSLLKQQLEAQDIKMGRDGFFNLLCENNLLLRRRKRKIVTTWSRHSFRKYPHLVKDFIPEGPNQLWVSDITYWKTENEILYLSLITDAYSRKIVGYDLSDNLASVNAQRALTMAITSATTPLAGLIHHSDRGIQYCTHEYIELLSKHRILISMTEHSDPLENAIAERINGIIKQEYLLQHAVKNKQEALKLLQQTVNTYNQHRPHLSCNMQTPDEIHQHQLQPKRLWKNYYRKKNNTFVNS